MEPRHRAQLACAAIIASVISVLPATANASREAVHVDITGGRKAHLRAGDLRCMLADETTSPDFYSVKVHGALGRGGGFSAHGPSEAIPGAYKANKAGINVSINHVQFAGLDGRGGHVTQSKDGTQLSFNVAIHRIGDGKPVAARARGKLTCSAKDVTPP